MQGDQVTDKNLCLSMLNQLKWNAVCLTNKILESADEQLRQDYTNVLNRTLGEQKMVYDFAHQQGWYSPMSADQHMVKQVQQELQKMHQEQQQSMMTMHQQAQQQAIQSPIHTQTWTSGPMTNFHGYASPAQQNQNQFQYGTMFQRSY